MSSLQVKPRTRSANIFINYRREDSAGHAGRLFDGLSDHFAGRLFMDVDTLEPGVDFVDAIEQAVGSCEALIVVIGRQWLTIEDKAGRRRLDDPADFVRLELESALARKIRVIPVLVQDASMPRAEELPPSLARLARRNAIELSDARWAYDVDRLAKTIQDVLGQDGILERRVAARPEKAPQPPAPAEPVAEAKTTRSRAWLLSLAALVLVAAVGQVSMALIRRAASADHGAPPVPTPDRAPSAGVVPGIGATVSTSASGEPTPSPAVAPSNGDGVLASASDDGPAAGGNVVAAVRKDVELVDRVESAANRGDDEPPRRTTAAPTVAEPAKRTTAVPTIASPVPKVEEAAIPSGGETSAPSAAAEPRSTPAPAPSARPARVTILSPRNGDVVGSDIVVRGFVSGLVDQQIFLGIRQKNGSIYPRGELFPNADGQWSIKLRSSKEKNFEILVMTSTSPEASQVLRDQRSRDDGLSVMPDGASISSDVVALKRRVKIVGVLTPDR